MFARRRRKDEKKIRRGEKKNTAINSLYLPDYRHPRVHVVSVFQRQAAATTIIDSELTLNNHVAIQLQLPAGQEGRSERLESLRLYDD